MARTLIAEESSARTRLLAGVPVTERRLDAAGISTAVLEGGAGEPIVLLHGPGEQAVKWSGILGDLASTRRVIAPDLPGHGSTEVPQGALTVERVLEWLDAVVEQTCASAPALVGQTIGGAIAARYAARRDVRIARLVLVDPLGLAPFRPAPEFAGALEEYLAQPGPGTYEALWRQCAFDLDRVRARMGDRWETLMAYALERVTAPGALAALGALMEQFGFGAIPAGELAGIAVPTRLIWGRHDLATSLAVGESASATYSWPLRVIEEAADDPATDQPERFVEALRWAIG
jgi:pimeloyl-ACP methyl ester carboxylesterase